MFIYNESFQDTTITPLLEVSAIKSLAPIGYQSSDNGIAFKVNNDGRSATVINLDATIFFSNIDAGISYYNIDLKDRQITVSYEDKEYILPISELGNNVSSIFNSEFSPYKILNITLPSTLIKINNYAFSIIDNPLKINNTINLPESLEYIGENAFLNYKMEKIIIEKNVKEIDANAFANTGLISIDFIGDILPKINTTESSTQFRTLTDCTGNFTFINCPTNLDSYNRDSNTWYGLKVKCSLVVDSQNSVDSSLKIEPQEMVQLSDSIIKVPIDRLLEVSNDITTAIDTVAQMAALNEFNFSAIGKQTTSSNLLMYIIIILIVAILAAVLFFVLRK